MHHVETIGHCAELLKTGISKRITSATFMNQEGLQRHTIWQINLLNPTNLIYFIQIVNLTEILGNGCECVE